MLICTAMLVKTWKLLLIISDLPFAFVLAFELHVATSHRFAKDEGWDGDAKTVALD